MARKVIVALVLFALVTFAEPASEAPASGGEASAAGPSGPIGNEASGPSSGGFAQAAPVGGPVPDGTFKDVPSADAAGTPPPKNGASTLGVSTVATVAAGFSLFYF